MSDEAYWRGYRDGLDKATRFYRNTPEPLVPGEGVIVREGMGESSTGVVIAVKRGMVLVESREPHGHWRMWWNESAVERRAPRT